MAAMEEQDSIPGFEEFMVPVMRIAADGELRSTRELGRLAADALGISSASREQTIKSGSPRWYSRAHWAITYLVQAGLLVRPSRGFVKITEEGRKLADNLPPRLDKKYLTRYPKFVEFLNRRGRSAGKTRPSGATSATESDQSPEELISEAVAANVAEVESDLLTLMRALEPDEFERLVLNVLITMGYGTEETATHTGRSGDEGIDGIIYRDALGLDRVYMQAKRHGGDNPVGPEAIHAFFGALQRKGADRGVFITSSTFSEGALRAGRDLRNIVLVDGSELAQLMVKHGLGVEVTSTHQLVRVNNDYFEEI